MKTKDDIHREVLDLVLPRKRSSVEVAPGVGKTRIVLRHIETIYKRVSTILQPGSINFIVCTSRKKAVQGYIKEAKELGLNYLLEHIDFVMWRSLNKMSNKYYFAYLDELHNMKKSHVAWLSGYNGGILGLTGTMPPVKGERFTRIQFYCPTIYRYLIENAVEEKILNDYRITVHMMSLDTSKTVKKKTKNGRVWYVSEVDAYKYWTDKLDVSVDPNEDFGDDNSQPLTKEEIQQLSILRMKTLQSLPSKVHYAKRLLTNYQDKVLLFVNTKEQADYCCSYSYHSSNLNSESNLAMFSSGEITQLSCVAQLSESVNIPSLKRGIITHTFSNTINATQRIARMLRLMVGEVAEIDILCYKNTVDIDWVKSALSKFDQGKITWYDTENF